MSGRRRSTGILLPALFAAAGARAQAPSGVPLTLPQERRFLVETEVSDYRPGGFVDHRGESDAFFRAPDLLLGIARVSYSPIQRLAIGVEVPYRRSRMDVEGAPAALTATGAPGARVFVDWSLLTSARADGAIRIGYFRAEKPERRALTVGDGIDRYSAKAWLTGGRDLLPRDWRTALGAELQYGRAREDGTELVFGRVDWNAGASVARAGRSRFFLLGLAGYEVATKAIEEGLFLHDLKLQRGFVGAVARSEWPDARALARSIDLSAEHDVYARNSLSGWRVRLAFRSGL